jgi:hypothetical protein
MGFLSANPPRAQEADKKGPLAADHHLAIAGVSGRNPDPALPKL